MNAIFMEPQLLIDQQAIDIIINRLCCQLIENHQDFSNSALIGIQPRGVYFAKRLHQTLEKLLGGNKVLYGNLDVTFFRDDVRRKEGLIPNATQIDFIIENKKIILIDDVLYTGRTIRAALDAMLAFGRPSKVELVALIDRHYARDLPIEANYVGKSVDTILSQVVKVEWQELDGQDRIWLMEK